MSFPSNLNHLFFVSSPIPIQIKTTSFTQRCLKPKSIAHSRIRRTNPHHFPYYMSISATQSTDSLSQWLSSNKCKVHKAVNLTPLDSRSKAALALSANSGLLKGTELAQLSEAVYLTSRTAKATLVSDFSGIDGMNGCDELEGESWLALQLLYERSKGKNSKVLPVLEMLSDIGCVDSLVLWLEKEMEWLEGSKVLERAREVRKGVEEEWEGLKAGGVIDAMFGEAEEGGLEMYRWAVGVVDARGVSVGREVVLAPVAMQLGVGMVPNASVSGANEGFFSGKKVVKIVLEKDVKEGEAICIGVGEGGDGVRNGELLLERGVVLEEKEADCVDVEFGLTKLDRFYEDKVEIIEEYGEGGERNGDITRFELRNGTNGTWEAPLGMDNLLRLVCLGGGDAFLLESVFRRDVWGHMSLPVSAENEKQVCAVVVGACGDALEVYKSEDGDEGSVRFKMAKRIVSAEREILTKVMKEYQRRGNSLDAVEYYAERRLNSLDLLRPVDESEIVDSESGARIGRAFDENY